MSAGFLGTVGSIATGQLQQMRGAEADRAAQDVSNQAREVKSGQQAESAQGVGEMEQDAEASPRDADGRRLWERPAKKKDAADEPDNSPDMPRSRDPSGMAGQQLDLSG